jgi:HD-like signal output (HDOD) protein
MNAIITPSVAREKALHALGQLPPFNPVLAKLMATLAREDVMLTDLADWIEKDAVLAGNVLRIVNSAAYGRSASISSVRQAIAILGTVKLRNIILAMQVARMMTQLKLPKGWSDTRFNQHAIATALMADLLAQYLPVDYAEGAFIAGLMHDLGKLMFAVGLPEAYSEVCQMQKQSGRPAIECESELLGVTHPELSLAVLEKWQLPLPIRAAVRHHHSPDENAAGPGLLSLSRAIQVADQAINGLGITLLPTDQPPVDPTPLLEEVGLKSKAERVIDAFHKDLSAMKAGI